MSPVFTIAIALVVEVGRRVEFRVTKARVSFLRRESYGLEARFKVNQDLYMGSTYKGELSPCAGVGGEQRAGDVAQLHHRPRSPQVATQSCPAIACLVESIYICINLTEAQLLIESFSGADSTLWLG